MSITLETYKEMLGKPSTLSYIRRQNADDLMNLTFTNDVGYKRVYVLTVNDGWQWMDAKYSKHSAVSMSKDAVDYYLQLRPHVKVPVGTYVFVPNDDDPDIGFSEANPAHPFQDVGFDLSKLWIVVGQTDDNQFVRYMILKCNWLFQWIKNHEIMSCYGCIRNANSYTSGIWTSDYTTLLDQITGAWLPDTNLVYGSKLAEYDLYDTRLIAHDMRFMITNNKIDPNIYRVTKVVDMSPQGLIKLTVKQDELDLKRDNVDLLICDYYDNSGEVQVTIPTDVPPDPTRSSVIRQAFINADGELDISDTYHLLEIGKTSYYTAEFSDADVVAQWVVALIDDTDSYTASEIKSLEKLMVVSNIDDTSISLRPGKSNKLKGLRFKLSVSDKSGEYSSSIDVEVAT